MVLRNVTVVDTRDGAFTLGYRRPRTNFGERPCSIARTLDVIGEPWSPLVLRDV
jgi:hypothetical protein